jgi:hypothetical protein
MTKKTACIPFLKKRCDDPNGIKGDSRNSEARMFDVLLNELQDELHDARNSQSLYIHDLKIDASYMLYTGGTNWVRVQYIGKLDDVYVFQATANTQYLIVKHHSHVYGIQEAT